ncbi:hypothetical protein PtA15_12A413 [Puccinia triticina]|uniref:RNA polymerase II assembly factor Rtp1 C-terminal domain-containing protein n=1 Tax=Puccinia triticina TaxID=208348 RepID=A0ABY7CYM3_9BASI|nr:uncharacterized protein PtA15_12A413 [Puccinia triticina]WAQ90424.1 hypothetical protein PtA15_12A413 [Puccinia triticina]
MKFANGRTNCSGQQENQKHNHPPSNCSPPSTKLGTLDTQAIQHTALHITQHTPDRRTILTLARIVLPDDLATPPSALHPRFALHQALFPALLAPLTARLISHPAEDQPLLHRLLDFASPKLVFATLLPLVSPKDDASGRAQTVSRVLSTRLLRPSGLRGLLQARFHSLYHILSHPSAAIPPTDYWATILTNLIRLILPPFFDQSAPAREPVKPPDTIRRAACFILSQIAIRQPDVFKAHLSPLLHAAFRPTPPPSNSEDHQTLVSPVQIDHALDLLHQLVLNSEPSPIFVDRLLAPILPQLLSLIVFLLRTRAEPGVRRAAEGLVDVWMGVHPPETVARWLGRAVRELEAGRELAPPRPTLALAASSSGCAASQWARDPAGRPCIKARPEAQPDSLDFALDPDALVGWLKSLKSPLFLGHLLAAWLEEVVLLRARPGFVEAKMTLFRIQLSLKVLDAFEIPQIVAQPAHFFPFILHALRLPLASPVPAPPSPKPPTKKKEQRADGPLTLDSLKFLDLDRESPVEPERQQGLLEEEEDDGDLDHGIIVAGLSLLLALLEGHPEMAEDNTPGLGEISGLLDGLLLSPTVSAEVYELGIKSRLLLSVRRALSLVDGGEREATEESRAAAEEQERLERQYRAGLGLLNDECLPLRAQGIVQLKTVLLTAPRSGRAARMVEGWAPGVVELLLRAVEEADSFEEAAIRDFDRAVRVAEAMVQVIQRAGTALSLYIDSLLPALLRVLHHSHPAAVPLKPSAWTVLATCVEHAPTALAPSLSGLVQACVSILSLTDPSEPPSSDDEPPSSSEEEEEQDPPPITAPIHAGHHRTSLHRAALLFVQSLLAQTLPLEPRRQDPLVAASLTQNALDSLALLRSVLAYY